MRASNQIIGSIIYEPQGIEELSGWIKPEMFENKIHREIYSFCLDEYQKGKKYNAFSVQENFKNNPEALKEITYSIENLITMDVKEAAAELEKEYLAGQLNWIASKVNVNSSNYEEILSRLQVKLEQMSTKVDYGVETLKQVSQKTRGKLFKDREMIHIGFTKLDSFLGKLDRGDVTVIGARPSVGKTALAIQIARMLSTQGYKVGLFSLEMTNEQVYERMICTEAWIPLQRIRNAKNFLGDEEKKFNEAADRIEKSTMVLADKIYSADQMRSMVKKMKLDIIVIDYLQLMTARGTYKGNRVAEIGEISTDLKKMASDLNCHVILLSQLNRESERKKKPTMADLRESGQIEQDASNVIMIWNLKTKDEKGVEVVKSRHGNLGGSVFKFQGDYQMFIELEDKDLKKEEEFEDAKGVPKFEV